MGVGQGRFKWLWLSMALLFLLRTPPGLAASASFTVAIEEWPPFRISDPAASTGYSGIDIDLLALLEKRLGIHFTVVRMPWARCLECLRTGDADLITGAAYTPERARYIAYVRPAYFSIGPVFYVQKGRAASIRTYDDLRGKLIGYSLKSAYFEPFDSDSGLRKQGEPTERQLLLMLAAGRLDAIIGTDVNVALDSRRLGVADKVEPALYRPRQRIDLFFGISRKSPLLARRAEMAAAISHLVRDGTVKAIAARYLP